MILILRVIHVKEMRNAYKSFVEKSKKDKPLGKPTCKLDRNNKINFKVV
jgi:hypothetical protein